MTSNQFQQLTEETVSLMSYTYSEPDWTCTLINNYNALWLNERKSVNFTGSRSDLLASGMHNSQNGSLKKLYYKHLQLHFPTHMSFLNVVTLNTFSLNASFQSTSRIIIFTCKYSNHSPPVFMSC